MRSEQEVRERLERIEARLDDRSGHDLSHSIGFRNALEWVLEDSSDSNFNTSSTHWSGQTGGQRF